MKMIHYLKINKEAEKNMKTRTIKNRRRRKRKRHITFLFLSLGIFASFYFLIEELKSEEFFENHSIGIDSLKGQKEAEISSIGKGIEGSNIPVILQNPQLPSGCESAAAVMLLNAYGFSADKEEFANALPWCELEQHNGKMYACHPSEAFVGSPYSGGYGVFSDIIAETMQEFIDQSGKEALAQNITGASEEEILEYLNQGTPVCIWITMDLKKITYKSGWYLKKGKSYTNEYFEWPGGEHCVLLTGCEEDIVTVHDPLRGKTNYDRSIFFQRYKDMGSQAVIITKG